MHYNFNPPLGPRRGRTLHVILVCRVSDVRPGKQRVTSTADQERLLREILAHVWKGPIEIKLISGSGSGENLERKEFLELCDLVETGEYDLVLVEDLGRIVRRMQAHMFAETCVDHDVRLVAINDHVDTAVDGWQDRSIFSAWHHERSNRDNSERIKRSHLASFDRGECLPANFVYGIVKPEGAKHDSECHMLPEAEAVYAEWFDRLDRGETYAEIADWLNAIGVPTGDGADATTWDCRMVGRTTHNPILAGWRFRNKYKTRRNSKGRYESRKGEPEDLRLRHVPHLAFFEEDYYDRVVAKVDAKNAHYARSGEENGRRRGSRKRTRFPGQSVYCGICGRLLVFNGLAKYDKLVCDGARQYRCWDAVSITGRLAATKIVTAIWAELERLPDFDKAFLAAVNLEADRLDADRVERLAKLDREIARLEREYEKLLGFEATDRLRAKQRDLESKLDEVTAERDRLRDTPSNRIEIPSADVIRELAAGELKSHALDDPAFVRVMHGIAPRIVVLPHRLLDGNRIVHRARFRLRLANPLDDGRAREALDGVMERVVEVDLFDPPEPEAFREKIVRLRAEGMTEREAAEACGITTTNAQRAAALQRCMDELGLHDPWLPLIEPPDDIPKLKRHRHPRFRFEPLDDAGEL